MRFTTWDGIEVVYEDGALNGDGYFISEIDAAVDDQELCGCDYWRAEPASLESDWSAYLTICGTIKRLTGSEPEVDVVPQNPDGYVPEGPVIDRSLTASACDLHGEFACNSKACAPPPVGTGGSLPSGSRSSRFSTRSGADPDTNLANVIRRLRLTEWSDDFFDSNDESWEEAIPKNPAVRIRAPWRAITSIAKDGEFKTQRETGRSEGLFNPEYRTSAERQLFGDGLKTFPVYGYIAERNGPTGLGYDSSAPLYGDIVFELKPSVNERTTVTFGDSLGAVRRFSDEPNVDLHDVAPLPLGDVWDVSPMRRYAATSTRNSYVEAQIHDPIRVEDISRIYVSTSSTDGSLGTLRVYKGTKIPLGTRGYPAWDGREDIVDELSGEEYVSIVRELFPNVEVVVVNDGAAFYGFSACTEHGEFACNSKACAPPPVGTGGSLPSGIGTSKRGKSPLGGSADHETVREYVDGLDREVSPVWRAVTERLGSTPDKLNPFNEENKVAAKIESNNRIIGKLKGSKQFQRGLKELLGRKVSDIVGTVTSDKDMIADVLHLAVRQGTDMRYTHASPVNPNETVRELLTRLSNGEFFDETEYGTNKLKGLSPEDILTASLTRMFVDGWARSSNDSDPRSISKQMAAAELHGFDYERFYAKEYKHHGSLVPKDIIDEARRQLNRDRDLLQALTTAEYDATQEFLKEAGIKTVTLFRGTKVEWDKLPMRGEVVNTDSNPLSSWTTDVRTARAFGGMVIAMEVPAEMVQSTTVTGRGCLVEYEAVVIGYPSEALVTKGKDNYE